jgi:hypothetical protein
VVWRVVWRVRVLRDFRLVEFNRVVLLIVMCVFVIFSSKSGFRVRILIRKCRGES